MLWDVVRGDTDGDVIDQIEAATQDEAWELAHDKYKPGWREHLDDDGVGFLNDDTWDCIYVREPPPWTEAGRAHEIARTVTIQRVDGELRMKLPEGVSQDLLDVLNRKFISKHLVFKKLPDK
jgi:hypothetical protein